MAHIDSSRASAAVRVLERPQLCWDRGRLLVTLALLALLAWTAASVADLTRLADAAGALASRPDLVAIFLASYTSAFALRATAWQLLMTAPPPLTRLFLILQIALLANHLFPTKVGEVLRVALLVRAKMPLTTAVTSTAIARALDFATVSTIALLLLAPAAGLMTGTTTLLALALAAVAAGAAVYQAAATGRFGRYAPVLPRPAARLLQQLEAAGAQLSLRRVLFALALVIPSWLLESGVLWAASQAAAVPLDLSAAIAVTAATIVLQAVQVTPGGLGVYEAGMTGALTVVGVDPALGLPVAITTHALKFVYSYASGFPCLLLEGLRPAVAEPVAHPMPPTIRRLARAAGWLLVLAVVAPIRLPRLWSRARHPLPALPAAPAGGTVAVIIPVHNEAATIGAVVQGVPREALAAAGHDVIVIAVDDGSDDGSGDIAAAAGADRVLRSGRCRGLGAALRAGLQEVCAAGAVAAAYLDGDGEYDPRDLPTVLAPVLSGQADYVLGVRFPAATAAMRPSRLWGNRLFTLLMTALTGMRLRDAQTGMRAFSARALAAAEIIHDYNYAQVLTINLLGKRMRLGQASVGYRPRQSGASFIRYPEYLALVLPAMVRELQRVT